VGMVVWAWLELGDLLIHTFLLSQKLLTKTDCTCVNKKVQ
jgi:hypothetical protein